MAIRCSGCAIWGRGSLREEKKKSWALQGGVRAGERWVWDLAPNFTGSREGSGGMATFGMQNGLRRVLNHPKWTQKRRLTLEKEDETFPFIAGGERCPNPKAGPSGASAARAVPDMLRVDFASPPSFQSSLFLVVDLVGVIKPHEILKHGEVAWWKPTGRRRQRGGFFPSSKDSPVRGVIASGRKIFTLLPCLLIRYWIVRGVTPIDHSGLKKKQPINNR